MEIDSQNIPRELIPSRGTVLSATHGNIDDPTFFLMLLNIYEKRELYISAKFEQNSENKESAYQIYKVCICHYAHVWKVKRRTLLGILVIPGLCRQSGFRIKNSISDTFLYVTHELHMIWGGPLLFLGQRSSSNLEPELCIISALIIHHLLLNDDDTLRMLQMT